MKSLTIRSALFCLVIAMSGCNSSSNSNGGGKPAPTPNGPGDVNVNQFDDNEKSTSELSANDQAVAFDALTDVGRSTYVNSKTQDAHSPNAGHETNPQPKPLVAAFVTKSTDNEKPKSADGQFYDSEELSQNMIKAVNQKQLCNPQVQQNVSELKSDMKFTTSGTKCPMIIETILSVTNTNSEGTYSSVADGTFKFAFNDLALPALKQQDLLSGDLTIKMNVKIKYPTEASPDMTTSGSGEESGKFISRKLGEMNGSKKMIFASEMKGVMNSGGTGGGQGNIVIPEMVARSVVQIELRAAGKRAVFTVKMDSQAVEPVKCTLNQKVIDLDQCEEMINKLNLREQTQPGQNSGSTGSDHG